MNKGLFVHLGGFMISFLAYNFIIGADEPTREDKKIFVVICIAVQFVCACINDYNNFYEEKI